MKKVCITLAAVAFGLGSAFAGCGKIETTEGKLKSFDEASKVAVIETKDGQTKKVTLTPTSKGADKVEKLVNKDVKVSTSHGKVTEIDKA